MLSKLTTHDTTGNIIVIIIIQPSIIRKLE